MQSVSIDIVMLAKALIQGELACYQQLSRAVQIMWICCGNSSNKPSLKDGHTKGRWKLRPSLPYYCPMTPSSISPSQVLEHCLIIAPCPQSSISPSQVSSYASSSSIHTSKWITWSELGNSVATRLASLLNIASRS